MDVPLRNVEGMWESVDTTNDSWAYAWYDEYWKSPREILRRLIACVGRGGTYMLNLGVRGDGAVPVRAARLLRAAGEWIRRYPQVVYAADASPWQHALPWGDVTAKGNKLYLSIFAWPTSGRLYLPGLKSEMVAARLLMGDRGESISFEKKRGWICFALPPRAPERLVSVVEVELDGAPDADPIWGLDPEAGTEIQAEFAEVSDATKDHTRWMEKFGEWKHVTRVHQWQQQGRATWEVEVLVPGDYQVDLTIAGNGRLVWGVGIKDGEHIQNQQNSSHNYQTFPIGLLEFPAPGRYEVSVSCLEGNIEEGSLQSIHFTRAQW
jgi:alpha-L-fucosidase